MRESERDEANASRWLLLVCLLPSCSLLLLLRHHHSRSLSSTPANCIYSTPVCLHRDRNGCDREGSDAWCVLDTDQEASDRAVIIIIDLDDRDDALDDIEHTNQLQRPVLGATTRSRARDRSTRTLDLSSASFQSRDGRLLRPPSRARRRAAGLDPREPPRHQAPTHDAGAAASLAPSRLWSATTARHGFS